MNELSPLYRTIFEYLDSKSSDIEFLEALKQSSVREGQRE